MINFLEVGGCIFMVFFLFTRFIVPVFENTGKEPGNIRFVIFPFILLVCLFINLRKVANTNFLEAKFPIVRRRVGENLIKKQ